MADGVPLSGCSVKAPVDSRILHVATDQRGSAGEFIGDFLGSELLCGVELRLRPHCGIHLCRRVQLR